MRSYNELFIDEFHNSQIIDETYADIYNNQGFKEAILYLKSIGATKLDTDNYNIKYWINKWTQSGSKDNEGKEKLCICQTDDGYRAFATSRRGSVPGAQAMRRLPDTGDGLRGATCL